MIGRGGRVMRLGFPLGGSWRRSRLMRGVGFRVALRPSSAARRFRRAAPSPEGEGKYLRVTSLGWAGGDDGLGRVVSLGWEGGDNKCGRALSAGWVGGDDKCGRVLSAGRVGGWREREEEKEERREGEKEGKEGKEKKGEKGKIKPRGKCRAALFKCLTFFK